MKNYTLLLLLIICSFGCTEKRSKKLLTLDSLKKNYAGKPINITLTNNPSSTAPITNQYAYTDKIKSDLAFKLESWYKYKVADEEGYGFIATTDKPQPDDNEMVLIEIINGEGKRGFVHYSLIKEFKDVSFYK
ncbi:hypothetical protein [Pedobacter sp. MC2016-24]|uniref:hypothetical protein n=1 Tax=Pedobacter sp. MC2016-24 TaxID=2780090 RepID=UPI0018827AF9|nr:hypothetical protein [Pedobacter sp. MC2016-24]MBE9598733.1 hypothetical protein [Pedobacter sp. MC2016-24]